MFIVIAQQKGGVGKTTTTANVAVLLANHGGRVLVVDTDPQFALNRHRGGGSDLPPVGCGRISE
jgi:chromosome partitioning protein